MESPKDRKVQPARPKKGHDAKLKRFRIVKLEERIAPRMSANHTRR